MALRTVASAVGVLVSTALMSQASASCVIQQAMNNIEYGYIQLNAQNAREMMPMLDELKKLIPSGNNDLPTGLQISPQASRRFEKISFDVLKVRSGGMILSAYVRDARVIAKMAQVAENVRKGQEYSERSPDGFYYRSCS